MEDINSQISDFENQIASLPVGYIQTNIDFSLYKHLSFFSYEQKPNEFSKS